MPKRNPTGAEDIRRALGNNVYKRTSYLGAGEGVRTYRIDEKGMLNTERVEIVAYDAEMRGVFKTEIPTKCIFEDERASPAETSAFRRAEKREMQ